MQKFGFRHIPKTGLFAAAAVAAVLFGGCGKTSNNLGSAADWYNDSVYGRCGRSRQPMGKRCFC